MGASRVRRRARELLRDRLLRRPRVRGGRHVVGIDLTYTAYMSPRGKLGHDQGGRARSELRHVRRPVRDVRVRGRDGGADGGPNEGSYVEIGFEPAVPLDDAPISLSFPVAIGASMSNYFEYENEMPDVYADGAFGFFSVGAALGVPLPIPEEYGSWELAIGVNALMFGEGLKMHSTARTRARGSSGCSESASGTDASRSRRRNCVTLSPPPEHRVPLRGPTRRAPAPVALRYDAPAGPAGGAEERESCKIGRRFGCGHPSPERHSAEDIG